MIQIIIKISILMTGLFLGLFSTFCLATTGYFTLGYGAKNVSMGGATVAAPQDALAASNNPAGMGLVGERIDVGVRLFSPSRESQLDTTTIGASFNVNNKSTRDFFMIPNFGISRQYSDHLSYGISVYGNGGMNTTYKRNIYDESAAVLGAGVPAIVPFGAGTSIPDTDTLGVDLAQAIITPSLSFKVHPKHHIGISALIGIQQFEARGLGNFHCFTASAIAANGGTVATCNAASVGAGFTRSTKLTNNGREWSFGLGGRVGWIGQLTERVTVAAAAASKIYMTEFDDYSELFAEQGDFDIPANITLGISLQATDNLLLAFDYQRIFYGDVASVANSGPIASATGPTLGAGSGLLGSDNGLGFGWRSINVFKFGTKYQVSNKCTFSGGYNYNESPIPDNQLLFNIISPAVNKHHITLGFTYRGNNGSEWNVAYMHAAHEKQSAITAFGLSGEIEMSQNSIELSYSWK